MTANARPTALPALTFLRFLAASAIVVHHNISVFRFPVLIEQLQLTLAVSFFFVLSGFILSYVHPRITTKAECLTFWRARIARCWPLHILTFFFYAYLFPYGMGYNTDGHPRLDTFFAQFFLIQAWIPSPFFFFSFNAPAWSVSVEFFFYMCYPLIAKVFQSRNKKIILATLLVTLSVAALCSALEQTLHGTNVRVWVGYINPASRLFEFVLGVCCSLIYAHNKTKISAHLSTVLQVITVGLVVIVFSSMASIQLALSSLKYVPEQAVYAFLWASIILAFSNNDGLLAKFCNHALPKKLGEISFAVYMLHAPLRDVARTYWESLGAQNSLLGFATYCLCLLILSFTIHEFFERPVRNLLTRKSVKLLAAQPGT